jgi:hypothetical protein
VSLRTFRSSARTDAERSFLLLLTISRYLWRQDQAIKAAKAAADEEAAAAAEPEPEPEAKPESPELIKQVEADLEALKATPSLPALWYAYGNITARIGMFSIETCLPLGSHWLKLLAA